VAVDVIIQLLREAAHQHVCILGRGHEENVDATSEISVASKFRFSVDLNAASG
jgi:hypothetical protein